MANIPEEPNTRLEQFLNAIATGDSSELPEPITREEAYLAFIAENGGGGGGTGEVNGVKGNVESTYRRGNVNLTLPNITNVGVGLEYDSNTKTIRSTAQYGTMPTPASIFQNKIIQYTGATNENYTNGYFYKCINESGTLKWKNIAVGPDSEALTQEQMDALLALLS